MWPRSYFAGRMFAPAFFPQSLGQSPAVLIGTTLRHRRRAAYIARTRR